MQYATLACLDVLGYEHITRAHSAQKFIVSFKPAEAPVEQPKPKTYLERLAEFQDKPEPVEIVPPTPRSEYQKNLKFVREESPPVPSQRGEEPKMEPGLLYDEVRRPAPTQVDPPVILPRRVETPKGIVYTPIEPISDPITGEKTKRKSKSKTEEFFDGDDWKKNFKKRPRSEFAEYVDILRKDLNYKG